MCAFLLVGAPTAAHAAGGGLSPSPWPSKPGNTKPPKIPFPKPPLNPIGSVEPRAETEPVAGEKDAADDAAIWVNPVDRAQSLVIGTDKADDALEVYDLMGNRLQRIPDRNGSVNNVDLRYGFPLGGQFVDIVVSGGTDVAVYKIDPVARRLVDVTAGEIRGANGAPGVCLYRSPYTGSFYVFTQAMDGMVEQLELFDNGAGLVDARSVRGPWDVHPEPVKVEDGEIEACTVDDATGDYYVAEQDVGVWRYDAEPTGSTLERTLVLSTYLVNDGALVPDIEGLAIVHDETGSYMLASSQGESAFALYRLGGTLTAPFELLRKFRVETGAGADGCTITDGIDATSLSLGPAFPHGMFVCQDNTNSEPGTTGNQNFKFVPLDAIIPGINPYLA